MVPHYSILWKEDDETSSKAASYVAQSLFDAKSEDASTRTSSLVDSLSSMKLISNNMYGGKESRIIYRNMTKGNQRNKKKIGVDTDLDEYTF